MNAGTHTNAGDVTLSGELTIFTVADNLARLRDAFRKYEEIRITFRDVTAMDISGMQLLCSVHRTAAAAGKVLHLQKPVPGLFHQVAQQSGFKRRKGCSFSPKTNCLCWEGGE